jgi:aminoglycoside phosphotransferase (APT) family kinase protein
VPGEVLRGRRQTDALPAAARHEIAFAMVDTLAALHAVDPAAVGLTGFGRPDGFLARQVRRWAGQLDRSTSRDLPGAAELRDRLAATVPQSPAPAIVHGDFRLDNLLVDVEAPAPAIVHGDFRLDNLLVDVEARRVTAVLDWEMATLGDPLTDLGLLLTYWEVLAAQDNGNPIADAIGPAAGFPSGAELLSRYAVGSPYDLDALDWYTALACYKLAVILEGIHFRYLHGQTVGAGFDRIGALVAPLLAAGLARLP